MNGVKAIGIFLHLNQFILAVLIIIGLHFTGQMYDLQDTMDKRKAYDAHFAKIDSLSGGGFGGARFRGARLRESEPLSLEERLQQLKEQQKAAFPYPDLYCTGVVWAIFAGILGLIALIFLIVGCIINISKHVKWYYLVAAILILLIASLGLGLNKGVEEYESCLHISAKEETDWRELHKFDPNIDEDWNEVKEERKTTTCFLTYGGMLKPRLKDPFYTPVIPTVPTRKPNDFQDSNFQEWRRGSLPKGRQDWNSNYQEQLNKLPSVGGNKLPQLSNPFGASANSISDAINFAMSQLSNPFSIPTARFPIFLLSVQLALAYIASFLLKCVEGSSSSTGPSPSGWAPPNQGQGQQGFDPQMQEQQPWGVNQMQEQEAKETGRISGQDPVPTKDGQPT